MNELWRRFGTGALALAIAQSCFAGYLSAQEPTVDQLLTRYFEIWNNGQVDQLADVVTPDFRRHAGPGERVESTLELADLIGQTRRLYHHLELKVTDQFGIEDGGAMRGTFRGVHSQVERIVEFDMMSIFRTRDGRLSEEWTFADNFLVLVGLGFQLTPPGFEVIPGSRPRPAGATGSGEATEASAVGEDAERGAPR